MKFVKPSFEIIEQEFPVSNKMDSSKTQLVSDLIEAMYKHIEICGRTCYKSLDKITSDSCHEFVNRMVKNDHTAMLEHGTVYLKVPYFSETTAFYLSNKYSVVNYKGKDMPMDDAMVERVVEEMCSEDDFAYITTNYRVIIQNGREADLKYMCAPDEEHEKRHTVKIICNRQVSHEFVRHKVMSFAQESTRYCNYMKDKFGSQLTFIAPLWMDASELESPDLGSPEYKFVKSLKTAESTYMSLIESGWKAQQAAIVLPADLKTELVITGTETDFKHFFDLRALGTTGAPHPQAKEIAEPMMEEFKRRGWLK